MAEDSSPVNILQWIEENKKYFLPPVCNKLLYKDQMKVMCIGGSNVRSDYHLEEGEELFYQFKGEMCLKVMEHGKAKDIPIKEGEIFILPSYIPHSPQRPPGTIGLVIERDRLANEMDGLRFYTNETNEEVLYEEWFHCTDLGKQLKPVIERYFASEAHKTGKPTEDSVQNAPFEVDTITTLGKPQLLADLLNNEGSQSWPLFSAPSEFFISAFRGNTDETSNDVETFLWQQKGKTTVEMTGKTVELNENDVFIIPENTSFKTKRDGNSICLHVRLDPKNNPHKI